MRQNEIQLKIRLIEMLIRDHKPRGWVGIEVPYFRGKRRIDVLHVLGSKLHVYEIKSDFDNLCKLKSQLDDYTTTFDYSSVVVSGKFKETICNHIPDIVGIFYIPEDSNSNLQLIRKPKRNQKIDAKKISYFLNKRELLDLIGKNKLKEFSDKDVYDIRKFVQINISIKNIKSKVLQKLTTKFKRRFEIFMQEAGQYITLEDLKVLSKEHMI